MSLVTREAARWLTRLRERPDDEALQRAFERWLAGDPAHAEEYRALCELWSDFDSTERSRALAREAQQQRLGRRRRRVRHTGMALLLLLGGGWLLPQAWEAWQTRPLQQIVLVTAAGEVRTSTLPDGSEVTLGAGSRVSATYSRRMRALRLERGEAGFTVEADPGRPFRVEAGAAQITVLGTRFVVAHAPEAVRVTVAQGRTRVSGTLGTLELVAGQAADIGAAGLPSRVARRFDDADGFAEGRIVFRDASLVELAATLSRYRATPVRALPGSDAGGPRVTAVVQADDIEVFLDALPRIAAVSVHHGAMETRLLPR